MMKRVFAVIALVGGLVLLEPAEGASDGQIIPSTDGSNLFIQIYGSSKIDWRLESTTNLLSWSSLGSFGTLLSAPTNPPARVAGDRAEVRRFFRAVQTEGLYDPTLLRTYYLTLTQANWASLLTTARTTGSNVYCAMLAMNNGSTNRGVGARYRGNTSFTGMGSAPAKKSINIEVDWPDTNASLMGYSTFNLNNAYQDETIMRESVYFNVMRRYAVCPAACMAQVYINGTNWGVYSHAQQQNGDLIRQYFPSNDGDRWRAPNLDGSGALVYLGNTNQSTYTLHYELKSDYSTNAWPRLINAIYLLNNTSSNVFREKIEDVLGVDRWIWFLVLENLFADDDSYWNKGSDYMMYFSPESGRLYPVEHDGNEAFFSGDVSLSPVYGTALTTRPVLRQFLSNPELKQRYLAHMRTLIEESYNPGAMTALVNQFHAVSITNIIADPVKGYTSMATYTNDLLALKMFITNRYNFLRTHAELTPLPPNIVSVAGPATEPKSTQVPYVTATVQSNGTNGISSVWIYHRGKGHGRFYSAEMFDDGAHGDGTAGDGVYGAATTNYPSGTKVRFYVEARSANPAKAASFSPARAEEVTHSYRVALSMATNTPVVINEVMASNSSTIADPQGEFDDWIELRNLTDQPVDLAGYYLTDEPGNMRKWQFPADTVLPADGYLIIWADEDTTAIPGLHASFKLSGLGEQIYLTDTDARANAVLDSIGFGDQTTDTSYGRSANDGDTWTPMPPTPGAENR